MSEASSNQMSEIWYHGLRMSFVLFDYSCLYCYDVNQLISSRYQVISLILFIANRNRNYECNWHYVYDILYIKFFVSIINIAKLSRHKIKIFFLTKPKSKCLLETNFVRMIPDYSNNSWATEHKLGSVESQFRKFFQACENWANSPSSSAIACYLLFSSRTLWTSGFTDSLNHSQNSFRGLSYKNTNRKWQFNVFLTISWLQECFLSINQHRFQHKIQIF